MNVRAKFTVTRIEQTLAHVPTGERDEKGYQKYEPRPCDTVRTAPGSAAFCEMRMSLTNPEVTGLFKLGQSYYLDFTEAPATE